MAQVTILGTESPNFVDDRMEEEPRSRFSGLFCGVLAGLAVLLCLPFAEIGFIDDWSYVRTAFDYAHTGHFMYNGWATAMLGWQIVWGAWFLKLFGYSFTVARLSMLPFAIGCGWLLHSILRRSNISNRNAIFGSLAFCLSPVFIPLAASFMSDVGGMFFILLCFYMCQRALEAKSDLSVILLLSAATAINLIGGTERQIVWLGALVVVPSAAWLLRSRRGVIPATVVLWLVSIAGILVLVGWFYHQPYSVPEKLISSRHQQASESVLPQQASDSISHQQAAGPASMLRWDRLKPGYIVFRLKAVPVVLVQTFLCLLLILLPVLVTWLVHFRRLGRSTQILLALLAAVLGFACWILSLLGHADVWLLPWLNDVLGAEGIKVHKWDMLGSRPISLPLPVRAVLSIIVILSGIAFGLWFASSRRKRKHQNAQSRWASSWKTLAIFFLPYISVYFLCLLPRALHALIFDRYLIGITFVAILFLLKLYEERISKSLPVLSYVVLCLFAFYGICATHDLFALNRARVTAVHEVRSSGVPKDSVQAGIEYDGWSEIDLAGYVNQPLIAYPADAFHPTNQDRNRPADCRLVWDSYTPALHPRYIIVLTPMWCLGPSTFAPVSYRGWLPPFSRRIYIQTVPPETAQP